MIKNTILRLIIISILVGCGSTITNSDVTQQPYMLPLQVTPLSNPEFTIDILNSGQVEISGTGVPGTPIKIVDVGELSTLAYTTVSQKGIYRINVPPLTINQWIGIQLDTDHPSNFRIEQFFGCKNCKDIPTIGILLVDGYVR